METRDLSSRNEGKGQRFPQKKEEGVVWGRLNQDIERIFENFNEDFRNIGTFLSSFMKENASSNLKVLPKIDLSETNKEYIIEANLPGVKETDLDMSISKDGILTIHGKRDIQKEQKERNYYRMERTYGSFERRLVLPDDSDTDKVNATFQNSILIINIPKKASVGSEEKKIKISNK